MRLHETKITLAEALADLSEEKPLKKISVSDIVSKVGINRKTFYYHFTDKTDLLIWLFRHDMATALRQYTEEEDLLYTNTNSDLDLFPYYVFIKEGVRSLDGSPFVRALVSAFEKRRPLYAQALADNSPDGLPAYLRELYTPALYCDTEYILSNRFLEKDQRCFLAQYQFEALLAYISLKLSQQEENIIESFGPFGNIVHASIADAIARHQQQRAANHT